MKNTSTCSIGKLIGRLLLCIIFIVAGIGKFLNYNATLDYMAAQGITFTAFFLIVAAIIEILGGLSLLLGYKTRIGALVLFLYLIPVTVLFHNFWSLEGADRQAQFVEFLKNLAILGGLAYVANAGPGCISLDACCGGTCSSDREPKVKE